MAKLLDLPDEILTLILERFDVVQQSPHLLRRTEARKGAAGRADLLCLARVCKRLHPVAKTLLHRNQWLDIDLAPGYEISPSYPRDHFENLARMTSCRHLQHLVCCLDPGSVGPFLACISNVVPTLRSLSLSIEAEPEGDSVEYMYLQKLSDLPHLVGLEIYMCNDPYNWQEIQVSPSRLQFLKELECGANTIYQLGDLLSMASPKALEALRIHWDLNEDYNQDVDWLTGLWFQSWPDTPMASVRRLSILCVGSDLEFPSDLLANIPRYFPCLDSFHIKYRSALSSERYLTIITDHSMSTSLTVSPDTVADLRLLLQSIKGGMETRSRLRAIQIEIKFIPAADYDSAPEVAQLWSEAYTAACSCGVKMSPASLLNAAVKRT